MSTADADDLRDRMKRLVGMTRRLAKQGTGNADLHLSICHRVADTFHLWEEDRFPTWLSRVVEGCIRDVENGE